MFKTLSTINHLYCGGQFNSWWNRVSIPEKPPIYRRSLTDTGLVQILTYDCCHDTPTKCTSLRDRRQTSKTLIVVNIYKKWLSLIRFPIISKYKVENSFSHTLITGTRKLDSLFYCTGSNTTHTPSSVGFLPFFSMTLTQPIYIGVDSKDALIETSACIYTTPNLIRLYNINTKENYKYFCTIQ